MKKLALEMLEKYYGYKNFRKGQEEIILSILENKDILAIMPTGGGKSLCYQIPALILDGLTLVISPLISLMKDQVDTLKSLGINAEYINSSLSELEFMNVLDKVKNQEIKMLYVAPERLKSIEFIEAITSNKIAQVAIDEAHCISQWGHDFRPSYKKIPLFLEKLSERPVITTFTATASNEVQEDILKSLKLKDPKVFITGFNRENLTINIIKSGSKNKYIFNYIEKNKASSGIIYCATRKEVENVFLKLKEKNYSVSKYHAGLSEIERKENQENFIHDKINIMVATNAFGMGIDKPNIRYVIHYNMPKNIEGYYQEIGRAGRDGEESECILLFTPGDIHIQKYLIEVSSENEERKENLYKKLKQMTDLIYSNSCYRKYILNFFGEDFNDNCNKCSNCLNKGEIIDKTLDTQKVLSCIYRMKKNFGLTMLVNVLRGSKNKNVTQFNFEELSTYGIMKNYSNEKLKNFINILISHGYIEMIQGTYPVLTLNEKSINVLKGNEEVQLKEFKVEEKIREENNELFSLLRELRHKLAREEGVPPYIIFGDATLREMSTKYPINKNQIFNITGVGERKFEKYGEVFISLINNYVVENNIVINSNDNEITNEVLQNDENLDIPFEVNSNLNLLKKLLILRDEFSIKQNIPPQLIICKSSLKEISGRYPITLEELKDISHFGPKKINDYGSSIIEIVKNYIKDANIERNWTVRKRRKLIIDGEFRSNKEISLDMVKENVNINEISKELELSVSTILGYITEYLDETGNNDIKINLDNLYDKESEDLIVKVCEKIGYNKISNIKKELPNHIKYESIRAVILKRYYFRKCS